MSGGTKILNYVFSQKNAKKYANFIGLFMLLLKEIFETYIIMLILFKKGHCNNFKIHFREI